MNKFIATLIFALLSFPACCCDKDFAHTNNKDSTIIPDAFGFSTSDPQLQATFDWAREMALKYKRDKSLKHPVGEWYEASLPGRSAFCMRDVSHQVIGAEIIGLSSHNLNMTRHFVENISESKDWCTWWEINWQGKPAPVDYRNDKEFWYNLDANFDLLQACVKLYEWTGNEAYLSEEDFLNFYEKTLNEYIDRWDLSTDKIMDRPRYMNTPSNFNELDNFHTCRGLASYVENFRNLTVSSDLIASIYSGCEAFSKACRIMGKKDEEVKYHEMACEYRSLLENKWWDEQTNQYYNFWTTDKEYHKGEGSSYILWFKATENPNRIAGTVKELLSRTWNEETQSYIPEILYRYGYDKQAYTQLMSLSSRSRADYPEVSYSVVASIVCGLMGIEPIASQTMVKTLSHYGEDMNDIVRVDRLPMLGGTANICHKGREFTEFKNTTGQEIIWRAAFSGRYETLYVSGFEQKAEITHDIMGNEYSFVDIPLKNGESTSVAIAK